MSAFVWYWAIAAVLWSASVVFLAIDARKGDAEFGTFVMAAVLWLVPCALWGLLVPLLVVTGLAWYVAKALRA